MDDKDLVKRIQDAIAHSRCVPIVGAGASIPVGAPSWVEYLGEMANGLKMKPAEFATADPLDAASYLRIERAKLGLPDPKVTIQGPSAIHQALAAWRCPLYVTTNYDSGMEDAIATFVRPQVILNDQMGDLVLPGSGGPGLDKHRQTGPIVVKLCSSSNHRNALSRHDFATLEHLERSATEFLLTVLRCYTAVFVGCSMRDPLIVSAINHAFALPVGSNLHVAIVPSSFSTVHREVLGTMGVQTLDYVRDDKVRSLGQILQACKAAPSGRQHLVIFEPGSTTKLHQLMSVIAKCPDLRIFRIVVVTESAAVEQASLMMQAHAPGAVQLDVVRVPDLGDTDWVIRQLANRSTYWEAIVAPYEFAVAHAAKFAAHWQGAYKLHFHSLEAADLSRDKRKFRQSLESGLPLKAMRNIPYRVIKLSEELSRASLLKKIVDEAQMIGTRRIVVKPPDAAGSIGVRPLDLTDEVAVKATLTDLVNILESMPVQSETAGCDVSELIVEARIDGEEFSVESRRNRSKLEMLSVHWKVDIDSDATRFFERLFVTLPVESSQYDQLVAANTELLERLGVHDGVFHAEFRVAANDGAVYPLEIGLRPGGGMVSASVEAARGVNLFEAALRTSLHQDRNETHGNRIVATGLVFAKRRGVLPPLMVRDLGGKRRYVNPDDPSSLQEWLRQRLATVSREAAHVALKDVMTRPNALCQGTLSAFDIEAHGRVGLQVKLERVDMLERPGVLITEEEACYIAGLLIVADDTLRPAMAVAESVAAMQLCLSWLECEPEDQLAAFDWRYTRLTTYPRWWSDLRDGGFLSDIDSWTFSLAIERFREEGNMPSILDLGCGSARPALRAVRAGCKYMGIDIDDVAIQHAMSNLAPLEKDDMWSLLTCDVFENSWLVDCEGSWDLLTANLPYLPATKGSLTNDQALRVDGGEDGLRFVERVFEIAKHFEASVVVLNISSLCNLVRLATQIQAHGFGVCRVVATLAPLEQYAATVREQVQHLSNTGLNRVFINGVDERQIIYALELQRQKGNPLAMMLEKAEAILKPASGALRTIAIGTSGW